MSHNFGYNVLTQSVLDVGVANQTRAGRQLAATDFTTLLGLSTPVGLWDLGSLTNLGSSGNLTNKGSVALTAKGVNGTANHATQFTGSTGQALYIADTGSSDPFRIKTGSWGCWFRTAKGGVSQYMMSKSNLAATQFAYGLKVESTNVTRVVLTADGGSFVTVEGITPTQDDRWHFGVAVVDGSTVKLYVDGVLEGQSVFANTLYQSANPFNIGAWGADGSTAATSPFYGCIAVSFVTPDVLNEDQIRALYAAKVPHGLTTVPAEVRVNVRRKKKGGPYVVGDFTTQPKVLYNFTAGALTDAGSLGYTLTNVNSSVAVAGADGQASGSFQFNGTNQYLANSTTLGWPTGTSSRSMGVWFKTTSVAANNVLMSYGGSGGFASVSFSMSATGALSGGMDDAASAPVSSAGYNNGAWHFAIITIDNAPSDGLKQKLYINGRFVAGDTSIGNTTGGSGIRIGSNLAQTVFWPGTADGAFVTDYAMAQDEISSLYAKGSLALGDSYKNPGDHVEVMDASNLYVVCDSLDSQHQVDFEVTP